MGCLIRSLGGALALLLAAITLRRMLERPVSIGPPAAGQVDTVVDGVRWRSREQGGGGVPVVYVHGMLSSSATWKKVLPSASGTRPAVAVDLPGFGFSERPWPYDYTVGGQAQALLRYLDARGFERVALVGNSLGGAVCLVAAAARPHRVTALVLVGSASPVSSIPWNFRLLRTPVVGELEMELFVRPVMTFALRYRLFAREHAAVVVNLQRADARRDVDDAAQVLQSPEPSHADGFPEPEVAAVRALLPTVMESVMTLAFMPSFTRPKSVSPT